MGRRTTGHIYLRSGSFWLEYVANGTRHRVSLHTDKEKTAKQTAAVILRPYTAATMADRRREAVAALRTAEEDIANAIAVRDRVLLDKAWDKFPYVETTRGSTRRHLKEKVIRNNRQAWDAFVEWMGKAHPGQKHLEDVTVETAKAYSEYCRDSSKDGAKLGARGHNKRIEICRVVFNLSGRANPFLQVKRWTEDHQHRDALDVKEVNDIINAATGEMRMLVLVGIFTGMRMGDAVSLQWKDIRTGRLFKKTQKTGTEISIAIHPTLAAELAKMEKQAGEDYVMPGLKALYDKEAPTLSKRLRELFESCGITVSEKQTGRLKEVSRRGFHCLRTTFITYAARSGVPTGAIAEWCGHSPEVDRIYQRWAGKETDARIMAALDVVGAAKPPDAMLEQGTEAEAASRRILALLNGVAVETLREIESTVGRMVGKIEVTK